MARITAVLCIAGAIVCAVYDIFVKHVPLMSWKLDPFTITGFILLIVALFVGSKIKPRSR